MKQQNLIAELESGLREIPLLDIHTQLDAEHLAIARALLWESPGTLCRMRPS